MDSDLIAKLVALEIPDKHLRKVLAVLSSHVPVPTLSAAAIRKRRQRDKERDISVTCHGTVTGQVTLPSPSPSSPLSPLSPTPPIPTLTPTPPPTPAYTHEDEPEIRDDPPAKGKKPWNPTPEQVLVASFVGRRPSTRWDAKEVKKWKELQPLDPDDLDAVRWYYLESGCNFVRKNLITLLNNWPGEIDRARTYDPKNDGRLI